MNDLSQDLPPELHGVVAQLEAHRPRMSGPQHDVVKRRAAARSRTSAVTTSRLTHGGFPRSRVALMALLISGALMSTGGTALGVSVLTTTEQASQAQYGSPSPQSGSSAATLGSGSEATPAAPDGAVANSASGAGDAPAGAADTTAAPAAEAATEVQATRQLTTTGANDLPFTGYAAITLLLGGVALLIGGLVLRRRTRHNVPL